MSTPRNSIIVPGKTIPLSNEYHLQAARSRVPVNWLQFTGHSRFHYIKRKRTILRVHQYRVPVANLALDDLGRQGIDHLLLDYPLQRPCAVDGIVAFFG